MPRNKLGDMSIEQAGDHLVGIVALRLRTTVLRQTATQGGVVVQAAKGVRQRGRVHRRHDQGRLAIRAVDSLIAPPAKLAGSILPSARSASVIAGRVPPRW